MSRTEKLVVLSLRLLLGWIFLYSGAVKILDPAWTAEGFLKNAQTFPTLYNVFVAPSILPVVNFVNVWGQFLLGASLILGIGVRLSSILGVLLMLLYYFPQLKFPYIGKNFYLVDQHIIYVLVLSYFALIRAGRIYGLESFFANLPFCRKIPKLRDWFG